jgi:hypothetical protein
MLMLPPALPFRRAKPSPVCLFVLNALDTPLMITRTSEPHRTNFRIAAGTTDLLYLCI